MSIVNMLGDAQPLTPSPSPEWRGEMDSGNGPADHLPKVH